MEEWKIVHKADDDDGNPTCWALKVGESKGHDMFIWISKYDDNEYIIEDSNGHNLNGNMKYKTLANAQRKARQLGLTQDDTGCFTN